MAPWHFVVYITAKWWPPLTFCTNYMIHTHIAEEISSLCCIILRYWTSLTHTGTTITFMLLLKRWESKFTTLSREMLCCCLNSQACLMERNSSVSPFLIFNHGLEPQKFGLWNNNLHNARAGIRNQSFCYAMLCCLSWWLVPNILLLWETKSYVVTAECMDFCGIRAKFKCRDASSAPVWISNMTFL